MNWTIGECWTQKQHKVSLTTKNLNILKIDITKIAPTLNFNFCLVDWWQNNSELSLWIPIQCENYKRLVKNFLTLYFLFLKISTQFLHAYNLFADSRFSPCQLCCSSNRHVYFIRHNNRNRLFEWRQQHQMKNSRAHTKPGRCACKTGCNHSNRFRSGLLVGSFANSPLFAPDNFTASRLAGKFRIHQRLVIKIKESREQMHKKKHLTNKNKGIKYTQNVDKRRRHKKWRADPDALSLNHIMCSASVW